MPNSRDYVDYVLELLEPLGPVTAKAMFGGHGLYLHGITFALIADDTLYLRVDDINRGAFEALGLKPFKPWADKPNTMPYHPPPDDALEESEALCAWARGAHEAALRQNRAKPPKKRKAPARP